MKLRLFLCPSFSFGGRNSAGAYANTNSGTFYGDERSFKTATGPINITIGMDYGGGKVGYVLQPGDVGYDPNIKHGLILAKDSTAYSLDWSLQEFGTFVLTNATGTAIGTPGPFRPIRSF